MKLTREYLSKLLPNFHRKSNHNPVKKPSASTRATGLHDGKRAPDLILNKEPASSVSPPSTLTLPKPADPPPDPVEMLDSVIKFLRRYLVCEDYQYTILALWIVNTWCFRSFQTAPYLQIRAAESHSAKTLCLRLLAALSNAPWFATGAHWRSIIENLTFKRNLHVGKNPPPAPKNTIMLDDCHHTFSPSERQNILSLLNSGSDAGCNYIDGLARHSVFGPKAFAGNAALPRSLSSRCIPIMLRRKKPNDPLARFNPDVVNSAASLARSLESWAMANSAALSKVGNQAPPRLPQGLNARQQDSAEPLLHIADRIGSTWPDRARGAIVAAFKLADDSLSIELLADIRAIFFIKEDPAYISTSDLLEGLTGIEYRPWAAWNKGSGGARRLAGLLRPLGVAARSFHKSASVSFRGYRREMFLDPWERYLPPIPADWPETRAAIKKEAEAAAKAAQP